MLCGLQLLILHTYVTTKLKIFINFLLIKSCHALHIKKTIYVTDIKFKTRLVIWSRIYI